MRLGKRLDAAQQGLRSHRKALDEARRQELDVARVVQGVDAEIAALEALGLRHEGVDPAIRGVLGLEDPGVVGSLLDFIEASREVAAAVETYLGPLAQALVVRDGASVDRIVRWFTDEWTEAGGLVLLPLDRVPEQGGGSLLDAVEATGEGAPWVAALLGEVDLVDSHGAGPSGLERPRLSIQGTVRDPRGFIKIGRPSGTSGVLERRARVEFLRGTLGDAETKAAKGETGRGERGIRNRIGRGRCGCGTPGVLDG